MGIGKRINYWFRLKVLILYFKNKWNRDSKVKLEKYDPEIHSKKEEDEPETVEDLELQCFTACLDNGFTEEQVSQVVQAEVVAFVAVKGAKGNSKGEQGSGKG